MFHCYRSARPDDDSIELLSADTSMVSLIKSRSNYSTALTMGLPHTIGIGALVKCGKRRVCREQKQRSRWKRIRFPFRSLSSARSEGTAFSGAFPPDLTVTDSLPHMSLVQVSLGIYAEDELRYIRPTGSRTSRSAAEEQVDDDSSEDEWDRGEVSWFSHYSSSFTELQTAFLDAFPPLPADLSPPGVSIGVPAVMPAGDHCEEITVSYSRTDNLLSIQVPRERTVIENSIGQTKWMAPKRGVSRTSNICGNLTTDITTKCADIELYRSRRAEEEAEVTSCYASVSTATMAQSQSEQSRRSRIKEFRKWRKMSAKILGCNCFKGLCATSPTDD